MIRMIATDLDRTLAPTNGPSTDSVRDLLCTFESLGIRIAIASGKPADYLAGLARQLGLANPLIIGENGCTLREGHIYPPKSHIKIETNPEYNKVIKRIVSHLQQNYSEYIWFQPNEVQLTVFWKVQEPEFAAKLITRIDSELSNTLHRDNYQCFLSPDCYDVLPINASKGKALMDYCTPRQIQPDQLITIGDNHNDASMFAITPNSIQIGHVEGLNAKWRFDTMQEALQWIESSLLSQ